MPNEDTKKQAVGPVGKQVTRNVDELMTVRGLSLQGLADRLAAIGRPIAKSQVHALSKGERRVDSDDLTALAIVLGVSPSALLLPRKVERQAPVELTPEVTRPAWIAWEWADGRMPLPVDEVPPFPHVDVPDSAAADFREHARPVFALRGRHPAVTTAEILLARILRAATEMDESNKEWWNAYIRRALTGLTIALDDWFDGNAPGDED